MMTAGCPNTVPCPVGALIPEVIGLIRAMRRYDDHNCSDLWAKSAERLAALEGVAATLRPTSMAGMFLSVCVAYGATEYWEEFTPEERAAQMKQRRQQKVALESVALALYSEEVAVIGDYYMTFAIQDRQAA